MCVYIYIYIYICVCVCVFVCTHLHTHYFRTQFATSKWSNRLYVEFFRVALYMEQLCHSLAAVTANSVYYSNCIITSCAFSYGCNKTECTARIPLPVRSCVVVDFRREVAENCALLGCYTASSVSSLPTFQHNLAVPT